jgi:hypothetical protein
MRWSWSATYRSLETGAKLCELLPRLVFFKKNLQLQADLSAMADKSACVYNLSCDSSASKFLGGR